MLQIGSAVQLAVQEEAVDITQLASGGKVNSDVAGAATQSALPFEQLGMSFSHGQ